VAIRKNSPIPNKSIYPPPQDRGTIENPWLRGLHKRDALDLADANFPLVEEAVDTFSSHIEVEKRKHGNKMEDAFNSTPLIVINENLNISLQ